MTETKKCKKYKPIFPGYTAEHFARSKSHKNARSASAGCLILIKNGYEKLVEILPPKNEHIIWLKIKNNSKSNIPSHMFGIVYTSPETSTYKPQSDFFSSLQEDISEKSTYGEVSLAGDFNSRTGLLSDTLEQIEDHTAFQSPPIYLPRHNTDTIVNKYGRKLIDICIHNGLQIINGRDLFSEYTGNFTYYGPNGNSAPDLLLCSPSSIQQIKDFKLLPRSVSSDHVPLSVTLNTKLELEKTSTQLRTYSRPFRYIWDVSKKDEYFESLKQLSDTPQYNDFICSVADDQYNTDQVTNKFYEYLKTSIDNVFKLRIAGNQNKFPCNPWFDSACKHLKSKINCMLKKDPNNSEIPTLTREYKRITQLKKRQHFYNKTQTIEKLCNSNLTQCWKYWKSLNPKTASSDKIGIVDFTKFYTTNTTLTQHTHFDMSFMNNLETAMTDIYSVDFDMPDSYNDILNGPITPEEISIALKKAKNNKSGGCDGISAEFFKHSNGALQNSLCALFNHVFNAGEYPEIWATGQIAPIHKKNAANDANNYRKISLLPALGKTFESILNNRLRFCRKISNDGDPFQNGFNEGARATDNIFILNGIIEKYQNLKKPLYICYVDFKSAFDLINRKALLYKIMKKQYGGKMYDIIKSMFNKSKSQVKWNGEIGDIFDNEHGVIQGGVISPLLFNIFLEDLPSYLDNQCGVKMDNIRISHILQADDLALISDTSTGLQKLIKGLETFSQRWHIEINIEKTKVMIFNKKCIVLPTIQNFKMNGKNIEETDSYKYLGTFISNKKDHYADNLKYIRNKALRSIASLRDKIRRSLKNHVSFRLLMKLFDSHVLPILDYGSEVWFTGNNIKDLEYVQLWFIKSSLGIKTQSSNLITFGDTGRFPLLLRQQDFALKYWDRLRNFDQSKPLYKVYSELRELHNNGYHNWYSKLIGILKNLKNVSITSDKFLINGKEVDSLYLSTKDMRYKNFIGSYFTLLNDSVKNPLLRTYKTFKFEARCEPYLLIPLQYKYRQAIARIRASSHHLGIELGRHTRPKPTPIDKRICIYCPNKVIDDEFHFVINCVKNIHERNLLFSKLPSHITGLESDELFVYLLSNNVDLHVRAFGKFLFDSFAARHPPDNGLVRS